MSASLRALLSDCLRNGIVGRSIDEMVAESGNQHHDNGNNYPGCGRADRF